MQISNILSNQLKFESNLEQVEPFMFGNVSVLSYENENDKEFLSEVPIWGLDPRLESFDNVTNYPFQKSFLTDQLSYNPNLDYIFNAKINESFEGENQEKKEEENQSNFFIYKKKNDQSTNIATQDIQIRPLFNITQTQNNEMLRNKTNRQMIPTKPEDIFRTRKYKDDNIISKCQIHFISYIFIFLNSIMKTLGFKEQFKDIDHKFKKHQNLDSFIELTQNATIKDIICHEISLKNSKFKEDLNYNINLCERIDNIIIENILNEKYINVFKYYYFQNKEKINLKDFGSENDLFVNLRQCKKKIITYQDKVKSFKEPDYENIYDRTVRDYYKVCRIDFYPGKKKNNCKYY